VVKLLPDGMMENKENPRNTLGVFQGHEKLLGTLSQHCIPSYICV